MSQAEILNLLLDSYERSGHCLPGKKSTRRIALSFTKGDYPPYRENDPCTENINCSVQSLADKGLVLFSWRKGYENWLLDKVYLNLDLLLKAYAEIGRIPLSELSASLYETLKETTKYITTQWKLDFLEDEMSSLQKKLRPSRLLSGDETQIRSLLKVLQYTERGPELMRVISANCFHNSKFLEQNLIPQLISIAKNYEPELLAYNAVGEELLTQSVVLEQLGILTHTEIFEFSGDVSINFSEESYATKAFQCGFCLQSENLDYIKNIDLSRIRTILFIENRTNYRSVIHQSFPRDKLIVYHGGFYSPAKRKLFRALKKGVQNSTKVLFWGDIDLGGFLMFTRLKKDVFPNLIPLKMSLDDYNIYKDRGVPHSSSYLTSLKQRMEDKQFDDVFFATAQSIITNGVTVEQEIML